jgi:capsular polysaccharide transport system permease protein
MTATTDPHPPPQPPQALRPRPRKLRGIRTIFALMLREMATTYGKSVIGYLWAIIEPAAGLALMTFAFTLFLRSPPLGTNFPLFFASGFLVFSAYVKVSSAVGQSVSFSRPLLDFPAVTPIDAILARFVLNFLTEIMVSIVILFGIIRGYDLTLFLDLPAMALAYAMAGALALGVGVFNCYLFIAFPSYAQIWSILNRPLFIMSCIFFIFDGVPQPFRDWLWYNPLVHVVGQLRKGIYATYDATYVSPLYVFGIATVLTLAGLFMIRTRLREAMLQ